MRTLPLVLAACVAPHEWPDPGAWQTSGPGGPSRSFTDAELWQDCAYLDGGELDVDHHNLVAMHDGWLVFPWAPEDGGGGVDFVDVSDPCNPVTVGSGYAEHMRESHTLAFSRVGDREYLAVDAIEAEKTGGVGFFDVTDPAAPTWVGSLALPGFDYFDSYLRINLSTFWQGPILYVPGGFNGLYVVDASDPANARVVNTVTFGSPGVLVGRVDVVGNLMMVTSAGLPATVMMDASDPLNPVPIAGGDFWVTDATGDFVNYYFASLGGRLALFARKDTGGGPVIYDVSDPAAPRWLGEYVEPAGDGGYVYRQGDLLFQGESELGNVYDIADPTAPSLVATIDLDGDFDTLTPIGNVMVASVDSGAVDGQGTAIVPFAAEPDAVPPRAELVSPFDGSASVALTSRIGVSFDEWVERASVHEGSFRVADRRGRPVAGTFNVQENLVNFTPDEPLDEDETWVVTLPAGGIADYSGNPLAEDVSWSFSTR